MRGERRHDRRAGGDRRTTDRRARSVGPPQGVERRAAQLPEASVPTSLEQVLHDTRERFVARFPAQCDSIGVLVESISTLGSAGPVVALKDVVHRLSGLAGQVGFPTITARASELEELARSASGGALFDVALARRAVEAMREAFTTELATPPPWSVPIPVSAVAGVTVLLAEDDSDQRAVVMSCLEGAGYRPIGVASGDLVVETARAERPAVILLDIALPRLDGYSVCRRLKADAELADIPVIFMTVGANLDDRLAGLALGADEFLNKPVDMRELVLRIQVLLDHRRRARRSPARPPGSASDQRELAYDVFLDLTRVEAAQSPVALAIVRVPADRRAEASALLCAEIRSRDAIGMYGSTHLIIVMPEMTAVLARERLESAVAHLTARGLAGICAGVSASLGGGTKAVQTLIAEADEALAAARYLGDKTAIWSERSEPSAAPTTARTILVAEDDPDVVGIVDAQMRAAGYNTLIAFDGNQALAAVRSHSPDVLVLDLMLPILTGFEILAQVQQMATRPGVIVLSARGREDDVTRAFELGADDYMTKPFSPQELMARVARLLR